MSETVHLIIGQYEPEEATSYYVEYWYNRHDRYWAIIVYDNLDREVESRTAGNKADMLSTLEDLAREYNTNDMRKA